MKRRTTQLPALLLAMGLAFSACGQGESASASSSSKNNISYQMGSVKTAVTLYDYPSLEGQVEHGEDYVIEWEDEGMEAHIRFLLEKPEGEIRHSDVWDIQFLEIDSRIFQGASVIDCALETPPNGQENFNFKTMIVDDNAGASVRKKLEGESFPEVKTLRDLRHFDSLQILSFSTELRGEAQLTDLSGLESCQYLRSLSLYTAAPATLAPLAQLSRLERLILRNCGTQDLAPLEELPALAILDLSGTQAPSLEPLTTLPSFFCLTYGSGGNIFATESGVPYPDLEPLTRTHIQYLDLGVSWNTGPAYKSVDFTPLASLPDLIYLDLCNHTTIDADLCSAILAGDPNLKYLSISGTAAYKKKSTLKTDSLEIFVAEFAP